MRLSGVLITTLLLALLSSGTQLPAQSRINGVVVDSLSGAARPLGSAVAVLPSLSRWSDADRMGRFTFDNVPAGRHTIVVMHPLLDSLDFARRSRLPVA